MPAFQTLWVPCSWREPLTGRDWRGGYPQVQPLKVMRGPCRGGQGAAPRVWESGAEHPGLDKMASAGAARAQGPSVPRHTVLTSVSHRFKNVSLIAKSVQMAMKLQTKFPGMVAGFDLVTVSRGLQGGGSHQRREAEKPRCRNQEGFGEQGNDDGWPCSRPRPSAFVPHGRCSLSSLF